MKKLFLSLSIVSSLFLVSCEDEFATNENNQTNENVHEECSNSGSQGYWDVTCDQRYEVVYVESCDTVWVSEKNRGNYELDCQRVPQQQLVEVCDSVWIETDSTWVIWLY